MESSPEDIEDAFLSSITFIIMGTIFLQFLIVYLAIDRLRPERRKGEVAARRSLQPTELPP